jgi:hypothetical protein
VRFTDPTGDAPAGADITSVAVSADVSGTYTFDTTFAAPYAGDRFVVIFDSDSDRLTGEPPAGVDYAIAYAQGSTTFFKWTGSAFDTVNAPSVAVSVSGTHVIAKINRRDIGGAGQLTFWLASLSGNGNSAASDQAPEDAGWRYNAPLQLVVHALRAGAPVAHKTWTYGIEVQRTDTQSSLGPEGAIRCSATGAGRALASVSHAFVSSGANGAWWALCTVPVPAGLARKPVQGTIGVSYSGNSVSHTFTGRVR